MSINAQHTTAAIAPIHIGQSVSISDLTQSFAINETNFASLADKSTFAALKDHLIEINISQEISKMNEGDFLEVTIPVVGITDFIPTSAPWHNLPQQFASILAINGYGQKEEGEQNDFPRPDYIVVKDIIGNEYEILVDHEGMVEIPDEGFGKFSIIKSLTYMYGYNQVMGDGFSNITDAGAQENILYLLPPPLSYKPFAPTIKVTTFDERLQKVVETEREVPILIKSVIDDTTTEFDITMAKENFDQGQLLHLDFAPKSTGSINFKPFNLMATFESLPEVNYSLEHTFEGEINILNNGWRPDPINSESFYKPVGLSKFSAKALVRNLFSEYDFTKDLIDGDDFGISQENSFNDFLLNPDSIGSLYDYLVEGLVNKSLPVDFLLEHVPVERVSELDLSYVPLDMHDSQVIEFATLKIMDGDFSEFKALFLGDGENNGEMLTQSLDVYALGKLLDTDPDIQIDVIHGKLESTENSIISPTEGEHSINLPDSFSEPLTGSQLEIGDDGFVRLHNQVDVFAKDYSQGFELDSSHDATTIHFDDVLSLGEEGSKIKGFDVNNDKIDLGILLENFEGMASTQVETQIQGSDVTINITNTETGEQVQVATLIGVNSGDLPDDLSYIITTDG